jgi:ADP-ribosyl-[dinitrogen reductase] hydrolase
MNTPIQLARSKHDRLRGALIGLAIGDALGAAIEFKLPGSFKPVMGFREGGPHGLAAGEWTDDTSMALALAESLSKGEFNLDDQAGEYLEWYRTGKYSVNGHCFDIGIQTSRALTRFEAYGDVNSSGDPSEQASGNGSIMRLAPVAMRYSSLYPTDIAQLGEYCDQSSIPTHRSPICRAACRYLGTAIAALISGEDRGIVLSPDWPALAQIGPLHESIAKTSRGEYRTKLPSQINGGGYVADSLEASIWAFHDSPDFKTAVLRAVNLGDDADTTGAVCGQVAGAYFGESGIPMEWRTGLARMDLIDVALNGLIGKKLSDELDN